MDTIKINSLPPSGLGGQSVECKCLRVHSLITKQVLYGTGVTAQLVQSLGSIVSAGSKVVVITEGILYESIARESIKRLERGGFRVEAQCLDSTPDNIDTISSVIKDIGEAEDAKLVMGIGGGSVLDCAKYIAAMAALPCYLLSTVPALLGSLTPSTMLFDGGFFEVSKSAPPAVLLCDTSNFGLLTPEYAASAIGEIAGVLCALFDWRVSHLISGEHYCPYLAQEAELIIDTATERLMGGEALLPTQAMVIAGECLVKLSCLSQLVGNSRLACGGETHVAHAIIMMRSNKGQKRRLYGEYVHMATLSVLDLYIQELRDNVLEGFFPPPDNNIRMELISDQLGVPWLKSGDKISPLYDRESHNIAVYKLIESKDELIAQATKAKSKAVLLKNAARKLYKDFGYSLISHITPDKMNMCLALAPDIREKFSLLSALKNIGLLERLLD